MSNTKPDLASDLELVDCAKATARVYAPRVEWDEYTPHMKGQLLKWSASARDFFRERWKPGPMPTPDLSKDTRVVALARVLLEANCGYYSISTPPDGTVDWGEFFAMADAAITHLGSGYVLPEATEANAERLAQAHAAVLGHDWQRMRTDDRYHATKIATHWLNSLPWAFSDPEEKPEPPAGQCSVPGCDRKFGHFTPHQRGDEVIEPECYCELSSLMMDGAPCPKHDAPKPDPAREGERRKERQELIWTALMAVGISGHFVASTAMSVAITYADSFLAWRDADNEKAEQEGTCTK